MTTISLTEPYAPRPVCTLAPLEIDGWRMKVYGISYRRERPRPQLEAAARQCATRQLPRPATDDGRHGVGFLGIHDGRGACFVFVDWWADENELHHHTWISPADRPADLQDHTATGLIACVWDLAIIGHERRAWIDHVLRLDPPDIDQYLRDRFRPPLGLTT